MRSIRGPLTEEERLAVVACVSEGMSFTAAGKDVGLSPARILAERRRDPEFEEWCLDAVEYARDVKADEVELELTRAAKEGLVKEIFGKDGELLRREKRQDTGAMSKLLEALRPEKFSQKQRIEATVSHRAMDIDVNNEQSQEVMSLLREGGLLGIGPGEDGVDSVEGSVEEADPDDEVHAADEL